MAFMCAVGAAILEHKLVHFELFISTAEMLDRNRLISGGLLDGFPDVALVDMDLPGARKVEVFGPCVGFVADEFYFCPSTCLVFATVVDVLTGYVSQNNCPHENFLEVNKRRRMWPRFRGLSPPTPVFSAALWGLVLASENAFEMLHHSLGNAVIVAVPHGGHRPYTTEVTG